MFPRKQILKEDGYGHACLSHCSLDIRESPPSASTAPTGSASLGDGPWQFVPSKKKLTVF